MTQLLAVYRTEDEAQRAARHALAAGASQREVRVDDPLDHVEAMRAEQHQELTESFLAPVRPFTPTPKEASKGTGVGVLVGAIVGAMLVAPIGAAATVGDLPLGGRLLIGALVGAGFGAAVGLVAGAALGAKGPEVPEEAAEGHTVHVDHDTLAVREAMAAEHPVRLDVLDDEGDPIETITTEPEPPITEKLGYELGREPGGDPEEWSDRP
jgi:hypothetical protein